jgi:hypothetical protein
LAYTHPLADTDAQTPGIEQCEEQVRRILRSATFRNASTLQQLLTFLAAKSIAGAGETLKEYTIGVEALGRKDDFDPKIDPIVRVQSHRLRTKLNEYYAVEGSHDPILVQIPKGHYLPTFEPLVAHSILTAPVSDDPKLAAPDKVFAVEDSTKRDVAEVRAPGTSPSRSTWFRRLRIIAITLILGVGVGVTGFWLGHLYPRIELGSGELSSVGNGAPSGTHDMVENFWSRFLNDDRAPVIAYPDAVFLLDDSNDLFRYRRGASDGRGARVEPHLARQFASNPQLVGMAGQLYYDNGYTGTGELEAVAMLAGLLGRMGVKPTIKSSRDLTPDDLNQHSVILLGSPFQNVAVAQLLTTGDFVFQNPDQHHEQWRAQIINAHPRNGESIAYSTERDAATRVLTSDYCLITIVAGLVPGRYIAFLGGLDTKGTQGATLFATSKFGVEQLVRALGTDSAPHAGDVPVFQALVRVRLAKGYQVLGAELTALHPMPTANPSRPKPDQVPAQR